MKVSRSDDMNGGVCAKGLGAGSKLVGGWDRVKGLLSIMESVYSLRWNLAAHPCSSGAAVVTPSISSA